MRDVFVVGTGMTAFSKSLSIGLKQLASEAVETALKDSALEAGSVQAVYFANAVGGLLTGQEMVRGQVALRETGMGGIPVINVENACASGAAALHLGWQSIAGGIHEVVLCVGVEKLSHEDRHQTFAAIDSASDVETRDELARSIGAPLDGSRSIFMDIYASLAKTYMELTGATRGHFADVSVKNQSNGARNPLAQYGRRCTQSEVLEGREIAWPLTLMMCSPVSDGAAAVILASREAASRYQLSGPRIRASVLRSGRGAAESSLRAAAKSAYEAAGLGPEEIDCAEVHDATAPAELMIYEDLGFAEPGGGADLLDSGATQLSGERPVNTSGGLLAKGHPVGATGIAQICEATWQLSGRAGRRQVEQARVALTQNSGGWLDDDYAAVAVHVLSRD